jgi:hypothetical protein
MGVFPLLFAYQIGDFGTLHINTDHKIEINTRVKKFAQLEMS